jgi:enamine deaminase RidA (YjgF/YER057c/UK114 family)
MTIELTNPPGLPTPSTYNHVAVANGSTMVFIAGQEPEDAHGHLVGPGDLAAQARQVFAQPRRGPRRGRCQPRAGRQDHDLRRPPPVPSTCRSSRRPGSRCSETTDHPDTVVGVQTLSRSEYLIEVDAIAVINNAAP